MVRTVLNIAGNNLKAEFHQRLMLVMTGVWRFLNTHEWYCLLNFFLSMVKGKSSLLKPGHLWFKLYCHASAVEVVHELMKR
jgi:hypothetical protein